MPSTGPTTEAGKAASSRNAVKHGLLSESPVVTALESQEEWEAHREAVLQDLLGGTSPIGNWKLEIGNSMQVCLAERAALLIWRLRRTAEAEIHWLNDQDRDAAEKKRDRSRIPGFDQINCLTRYEAHLGRELARTMKALKDLQTRPAPTADQSEISNQHSPISNTSPNGERTLNGSMPVLFDKPDNARSGGTTENYQTNSTPAEEPSETPSLQHSTTPAELNPSPTDVPAAEDDQKICETNSVSVAERSETPPVPTNSGILHLSRPTREHSITPAGQNSPPRKPHESETAECRSVPAPAGFYWSFERRCFRPPPSKPREA